MDLWSGVDPFQMLRCSSEVTGYCYVALNSPADSLSGLGGPELRVLSYEEMPSFIFEQSCERRRTAE